MSNPKPSDHIQRGELTRCGWAQGVLFELPTASLLWNSLDEDDINAGVTTIEYADLDDDALLMMATQDCDLDARGETEPYVEALVCRVTPDGNIRRAAKRNSSRWFLIDEQEQLVAYAVDRLQIDKRVLRSLTPQPWPGTQDQFRRFRTWLARRYDRPAIPDPVVEAFQQPMNEQMDRLEKRHATVMDSFSNAVSEIRIHVPPHDEPPFSIKALLVTERFGISEAEEAAIEKVMGDVASKLDPSQASLDDWRVLHPEEISMAEYFATRPLLYDYLTYYGDEVTRATPISET